jgi:hypothetical protein
MDTRKSVRLYRVIMKIIKYILYKPYLLLLVYLILNFYFFGKGHSLGETISNILLLCLNIILITFLFFKLLRNSLVRLVNRISILYTVPDYVLTGYLFIFTLINPIIAVILAIITKLFIRDKKREKTYIDEYGNEVTQIKSLTPTIILSRKEQKTGEEEHIVMTKLKKKPRKVIYE